MARTIFQSAVWKKQPQCSRLFIWLIGNVNHADGYTFKGHVLLRGQMITTYSAIADALSYFFNKSIIRPTVKEIRIMLSWLQSEGMITVEPLIDGTSPHKGRPSDLTRAYVGLLISVINYDPYQRTESYKGRDKGRPSVAQGQLRTITTIKTFLSDSVEIRLSELLLNKIISRNPNHKQPDLQTWAKDVDLMIRLDKRSPEDIQRVIEWCQDNTFWQSNILSTAMLRKQFDQLLIKMGGAGSPSRPSILDAVTCSRCGRMIIVLSDLTDGGCVYCLNEARV
jgi:hypothetical protein